jgi:acyl carrier protein
LQIIANHRKRLLNRFIRMADLDTLKLRIKETMVEELMLPFGVEGIADDAQIFNPQGLALDSVDALQLVVALEKRFNLKLGDAAAAREVLQSVNTIAGALVEKGLA